jgi:hypothetical protein
MRHLKLFALKFTLASPACASPARGEEFPVRTCKAVAQRLLPLDIYYGASGGAPSLRHNKE